MTTKHLDKRAHRRVAHYWSWVAKRQELGYWNAPGWEKHQNLLSSGSPHRSWLDVFHNYLNDISFQPTHALSIGCGAGSLEPLLLQHKLCTTLDACDVNPHLIQQAAKTAKQHQIPIRYFISDLNHPNFTAGSYDLVVGCSIFHHIQNLEQLFHHLVNALKPTGRLLMYDYVGPSRFQWTDAQTRICNDWLMKLPKRFKIKQGYPWYYRFAKNVFDLLPLSKHPAVETILRSTCPRMITAQFLRLKQAKLVADILTPPHPEQFLVTDPSEAIRSVEIMPILQRYFVIEKMVPMGGTIAQPLFGRLVANFLRDTEGSQWAEAILEQERIEIQSGRLTSDLVALIARPIQ